jgi:hypothetical protein
MPARSVPKPGPSKVTAMKPVSMVSRTGVSYSIECVTPATAEQWLTKNTANRKVRRARVDRYARDMLTGSFLENGASICFAADGTLLDGQHRLMAVVQAGVSVWMLVVRDLPNVTQDTMDDLPVRTLADTFGFHQIANNHTAAAVTRRVLMWQSGAQQNRGGKEPTKSESLEAWRTDSTLPIAVEAAIGAKSGQKLVPPSIAGLTFWVFYQIDPTDCVEFMEKLIKGLGLTGEGDPVYIVRNQIKKRTDDAGRVPETEFLAWVIKAWNHYRVGKTLAPTYRYKITAREKFPEPK